MRRPDVFTLDYSHPLAQGLVFARLEHERDLGLHRLAGQSVGATHSIDDAGRKISSFAGTSGNGVLFQSPVTTMSLEPLTISAWALCLDALPVNDVIVFIHNESVAFRYISVAFSRADGVNRIQVETRFDSSGTRLAHSTNYVQNEWKHIIAEIIPSTHQLVYVDGMLGGTQATPASSALTATHCRIGTASPAQTWNLSGAVGDVLIHNRALSPAEIAILADRTDPMLGGLVREVNPVAYFDFGGASAGTDNLTADDLVTGSPALGTPALGQVHALTATGITTSAPVLGTPALGQVHGLATTGLTTDAPVLGTPEVGQDHSLTASALVVGSPALGTPALTENAPDVDALTAVDLVVSSPVLGTPALGQIHVLGSDGLVAGAPVLGSPSITQIHALTALGLTVGVPVLGTPALNRVISDLQVRAELNTIGSNQHTTQSFGTFNAELQLFGTTKIELICIANFEVNELGE